MNEEIDESVLWLQIADALLDRLRSLSGAVQPRSPVCHDEIHNSLREGLELRAMFAKACRTFRNRR